MLSYKFSGGTLEVRREIGSTQFEIACITGDKGAEKLAARLERLFVGLYSGQVTVMAPIIKPGAEKQLQLLRFQAATKQILPKLLESALFAVTTEQGCPSCAELHCIKKCGTVAEDLKIVGNAVDQEISQAVLTLCKPLWLENALQHSIASQDTRLEPFRR